jgi:uncharacterized protein YjeT (DUF2065 family)
MTDLIVGLGIAMVIEGALYALWPEAMTRFMAMIQGQAPGSLRTAGVVLAAVGVGIVWLVRG